MSDGLEEGASSPLGATPSPDGVNFSVFSRHATGVRLLLFDRVDDARATRVVHLDPSANRTYCHWHVFVPGVRPGHLYGYQVEDPLDPASGMRFDPDKVLLDPYGRGVIVPRTYGRDAAGRPGDNTGTAMMSVVVDVSAYDWEGDAPLQRPWEPLEFELSPIAGGGRLPWRRWIDTFLDSPHDIVDWERAPSVGGRTYSTVPRSVVVLFARLDPE